MEKNNIQDAIKNIFSSLISNHENEVKVNYAEIISNLKNSGYDIENLDTFNVMVSWELSQILGIVVTEICSLPHDINNLSTIKFLYLNYNFMKNNIEKLIVRREGSCCCADKSRHILNMYKEYLISGYVPELNNERHYWVFNFGEYKDWIDLCEGLIHMYYGNNQKYLLAYKKLIESEIRNREECS